MSKLCFGHIEYILSQSLYLMYRVETKMWAVLIVVWPCRKYMLWISLYIGVFIFYAPPWTMDIWMVTVDNQNGVLSLRLTDIIWYFQLRPSINDSYSVTSQLIGIGDSITILAMCQLKTSRSQQKSTSRSYRIRFTTSTGTFVFNSIPITKYRDLSYVCEE